MAKAAATTTAKAMTKTDVLTALAEKTGVAKKDVGAVFEALGGLIGQQLSKKGPGVFTVPGLMKLKVRVKPAVPAGMRKNPFTGEMAMGAAKPASRAVRVTALKKLKDMV